MLSTKVKSTRDLMSIALQTEREAIRRYSQLAANMRDAGNDSAAALFERMVSEEQEHARLLLAWMAKESIALNPEIGPIRWRDPQVSTTYNDEARDPLHSTPYKVLAFAVNNEENAFRFYTHVAAEAEDETVHQYAEILAREELGHVALLRVERRLAFHAERDASAAASVADPRSIQNEIELLAAAIEIDRYLGDAIGQIDSDSPQLAALARETRLKISNNENTLNSLAPDYRRIPGTEIVRSLAQSGASEAMTAGKSGGPDPELQRLSDYCDASFAFYDAIVESTADESIMRTAQALTASALDRIGVLKRMIANE
ncbi:MAG: ferritin family protein [Gammaproteobacteria bacterium]|nr:ferritin family protein [Gammaproteobacteria bacterium]